MADTINYAMTLSVSSGGPSLTANNHITVDGFVKADPTIVGSGHIRVDVTDGDVAAILITADTYSEDLSFTNGGATSGDINIVLDAPQELVGGGVALLGDLETLVFTNATSGAIGVHILAGLEVIED